MNANQLPVNYALSQPVSEQISDVSPSAVLQELAAFLSSPTNLKGIPQKNPLGVPKQKKLITLINCQLDKEGGRICAMKTARYLGERCLKDLIVLHQNPRQLAADLFTAVRARGCHFLGPTVQEEALRLILLSLEDGSGLSRKVLVMRVLKCLVSRFQASKTSVGNVVQLLYRASCFKVSRREGDSSLLHLKEEYCTYGALRRKHDAEMVQIAMEAGLCISPEQWSSLLYGDAGHISYMQSIIAKLQTPQSFYQSIDELIIALQRNGDPDNLFALKPHLEFLAGIDPDPPPPSCKDLKLALEAVKFVLKGLVELVQRFDNHRLQGDRKHLDNDVPSHAFDRLSISEGCTFASPVIDSNAGNDFYNVKVNTSCPVSFLPDSYPTIPAALALNPESPVFTPTVKLPRAILKQSSQQILSSTNTPCPENIGSSLSTVDVIHASKLKPSNNCHAQQSVRNSPYFSKDPFPSVDSCLQNSVMPIVHCRDPFLLKSGLENQHLDSNQNVTAAFRKKQLQAQIYKQVNECLSGSENNFIATNMETPFCLFKTAPTENDISFHSPCTPKRKIKGRHGISSTSYSDSTSLSLNLPFNEFNSTKFKIDSEIECPSLEPFCPSDKDEFIPFEPSLVSKYGHISRYSESLLCGPIQANTISEMSELTTPISVGQHSLPSADLAPSFCAPTSVSSAVPVAVISDQYVPIIESASVLMPDNVDSTSSKAGENCNS